MKDQLQAKLVEILTGIQTAVGKASDFALEQLPDIATQFIKFKTVWYSFELLVAIAVMVWLWKVGTRLFKTAKEEQESEIGVLGVVVRGISLGAFFVAMSNAYQLMMVTIAPKVWLLYQLADMVKGGCK